MDFTAALNAFIAAYQKVLDAQNGSFKHYGKVKLEAGSKFIRVVRTNGNDEGGSVACFVCKATGGIYKAASFKAPAKGERASIFNPESYAKMEPYGGWLYCR
jgi:hypothetical protein